jgi:MFS family permease
MRLSFSVIAPPLAGLILFVMGSSVLLSYVAVRLGIEGFSLFWIGFLSTIYFLGIFVGAHQAEKWILPLGHARCFIVSSLIYGVLSLLMIPYIAIWYWTILRFIAGMATAGIYVSIESWLAMESGSGKRGQMLSFYMISFYIAVAAGQFLLDIGTTRSPCVFVIAALFSIFAPLCVLKMPVSCPLHFAPSPMKIHKIFLHSPLGTIGGILTGMVMGSVYGLLPAYGAGIDLPISKIALLVSVVIIGGLLMQWPAGRLSDKLDRRMVILISAFLSIIASFSIIFLSDSYFFYLVPLFGGFTFVIYPVTTAHACDKAKQTEIIKTISTMVFLYGLGALIGPLIAPFFMHYLGPSGLFYFFIAVLGTLSLYILFHMAKYPKTVQERKIRFFPLSRTPEGSLLNPRRRIDEE